MTTPVDHREQSHPPRQCALSFSVSTTPVSSHFFSENITFSPSVFMLFILGTKTIHVSSVHYSCNINFCVSIFMFYIWFYCFIVFVFSFLCTCSFFCSPSIAVKSKFSKSALFMSTDLFRRQYHQAGQHSPRQCGGPPGGSTSRYHLHQTDCV